MSAEGGMLALDVLHRSPEVHEIPDGPGTAGTASEAQSAGAKPCGPPYSSCCKPKVAKRSERSSRYLFSSIINGYFGRVYTFTTGIKTTRTGATELSPILSLLCYHIFAFPLGAISQFEYQWVHIRVIYASSPNRQARSAAWAVLPHRTHYWITGGSGPRLSARLANLQLSTPPCNAIAGPLAPRPIVLHALMVSFQFPIYPKLKPAQSGHLGILYKDHPSSHSWLIKHSSLTISLSYQLISSTHQLHIYDTLVMFSKVFALSTLLGLLAAMPAQATTVEVVAGGPDGLIQYNPSFVVGVPYYFPS